MTRQQDLKAMWKHLAEEINVKQIAVNGSIVYSDPLIIDKYKDKIRQFNEIYNPVTNAEREC